MNRRVAASSIGQVADGLQFAHDIRRGGPPLTTYESPRHIADRSSSSFVVLASCGDLFGRFLIDSGNKNAVLLVGYVVVVVVVVHQIEFLASKEILTMAFRLED
jgi:hypothetical protein